MAGSTRRRGCRDARGIVLRIEPAIRTNSGEVERRTASGRKSGDARRVLCSGTERRRHGSARERRDRRRSGQRQNAARQVLQDLALEAIVIDRMRRAARNLRSVRAMLVQGVTGIGERGLQRRRRFVRGEIEVEPGQRAQRRPDQCGQRVGCDPQTPAPAARCAVLRAEPRQVRQHGWK